jgi:hypothetical protein
MTEAPRSIWRIPRRSLRPTHGEPGIRRADFDTAARFRSLFEDSYRDTGSLLIGSAVGGWDVVP